MQAHTLETQFNVLEADHHQRLDAVLARKLPLYSRANIQQWIKQGNVQVDQQVVTKCNFKVSHPQSLAIRAELSSNEDQWIAQPMPLDILYCDHHLIILNKPSGCVVHPGAGHRDHTLINGLLARFPEMHHVTRCGVIHRLDKDTTGAIVFARTNESYQKLVKALQLRQIERYYHAFVFGKPYIERLIESNIIRHPSQRTKMAATAAQGKFASTHYRLKKTYHPLFHLLEIKLGTGRTHQIRVHLSSHHLPILGDFTYGWKSSMTQSLPPETKQTIDTMSHQALHACRLCLQHPFTQEPLVIHAPYAPHMQMVRTALDQAAEADNE